MHEHEAHEAEGEQHLDDGRDGEHRGGRVAEAVRSGGGRGDEVRARIQRLLVTGDNWLKQGVAPEKARESYEQALAVAREAGIEDEVRPLVEVRLADLDRLAR